MIRLSNWKTRLVQYLAQHIDEQYEIGTFDCALFAAGAIEAMTGTDIAAPFKGKYRSFARGYALMQAAGHADHVAYFASLLPEVHPSAAAPGDIAVVDVDGDAALGVVQGEMVYALAERGLVLIPLREVSRCFKV